MAWSRGLYLAGIVLALVLIVPTQWFPFQLAKVGVFALCLFAAAVLFALGGGMRTLLRSHGLAGALLVALIPVSYLVSTYFSVDRSVAFTGFNIETDTVVFAVLVFLAFLFSYVFFRTLRPVRLLVMVVFWSLIAAAVFQCVSILFGSAAIPLATFADRSVNVVGKWNDLGIMVGLLSLLMLARVELMSTSTLWRIVTGALLLVLAFLLGLINFPIVWGLLLAGCVILAAVRFLIQRAEPNAAPRTWAARMPLFSFAGAIIALLFLFFGTNFNNGLTSMFPVSSLEVRPAYSSTLTIISAARGSSLERLLVGTGPNTFAQEWLLHRPAAVNQSNFWNLDFNVGFSTFITALGTVGLLGALAWLIPLFLVLAGLVRVLRLGVLNREDKIIAATLSLSSLFLLASLILYVPSQNIILLAMVFAGATFGFLWRQGQSGAEEPAPRRLSQVASLAFMALLVLLSLWACVASNRRLIAEAYVGHGSTVLASGDADTALADASRANAVERTGDGLRLVLQAGTAKLQALASSDTANSSTTQQQFAAVVQSTIQAGQEAQALNPHDYRPTMALAQVYDYLASLSVQGAAQTALNAYQAAQALDPTNPTIPLNEARLAANNGNLSLTTQFLSQALTLKPNYTDAILLVVQLDVANKDIPSAIKAATAASQTAPGVAPIWFELGLLYYSSGDATNAAKALEQAVTIEPDYANAQYFLGLSYAALGQTPKAIGQFQALARTNPDNAEVKLILSNLQAGKSPFANETPAQPPPQTRSTAPVSQ